MPYGEKIRYDSFMHITTMASIAGISKMIIDEACRYHKLIAEHKTFRGDNRDGIIAASIYLACRIENCPRTAKEIAQMFNLDGTSATKGCTNAMKIINEFEVGTRYGATTPHSFIERYCTRLQLAPDMTRLAEFISIQIDKQNLIPENTPHAVAAGIVFFIATEFGLPLDKALIRQVSSISEVTILKCYKKIDHHKTSLIPPAVYAKYKGTP
jgi:transcription initiation factor TFIIB